ncbi:hypothetical protein [Pedobacter chitinilyticus]|uniref:Uncharacterized protein n=1 Tax=Pedobacter chitinilyticus TaxID=2233776 RepID=A0A443YW34_9SPHI|nr:hypothetical protein [Pedobacter chitinilyticus]RWU08176.1 hypothetical protein DPV69_07280 [Pedobacter chitinilyticus]
MDLKQIQQASYYVSGLQGFVLSEAMRLWKTKFETLQDFQREVIIHHSLNELGNFVSEMWETIAPITIAQALSEQNLEKRRVMFDCIGVAKLFAGLEAKLLDKTTLQKVRTRWDEENKPYRHTFEDTYELYQIDSEKLFGVQPTLRQLTPVFAVRCWCTTTSREYWIYVPELAALGVQRWQLKDAKPDAIRAIAWTIRIDITEPKRIYRQGDIIVVEESENSREVAPYHLNREQYLELMYSET